jgi:hypothetical protein
MFNFSNQKLIARKLVNVRPNSRFSPSSPVFQTNSFSFDQYHNFNDDTTDLLSFNSNIKATVDQFMESTDFLNNNR